MTNSPQVNINDQQKVDELSVSTSWKSIGVLILSEANCLLLPPFALKIAKNFNIFWSKLLPFAAGCSKNCPEFQYFLKQIASFCCRLLQKLPPFPFAPNIRGSQMVAVQWWQMLAHDGNNFPYNCATFPSDIYLICHFFSTLSRITKKKYLCLFNLERFF